MYRFTLYNQSNIDFNGKSFNNRNYWSRWYISLKKYTLTIVLGLSITCFFAGVVFNVVLLFFVIYFLRLFGQGLMGHTSRTTMARYFKANRGKALAISGFGFSFGEMIYPFVVVILILTFGWRITWFSSSVFIIIFFGGED